MDPCANSCRPAAGPVSGKWDLHKVSVLIDLFDGIGRRERRSVFGRIQVKRRASPPGRYRRVVVLHINTGEFSLVAASPVTHQWQGLSDSAVIDSPVAEGTITTIYVEHELVGRGVVAGRSGMPDADAIRRADAGRRRLVTVIQGCDL